MIGKKEEAKEQKKNLQSLVIITHNSQTNPLKILYLKMFITYSSKFGLQTRGEKTITVSGYWQKPLTVTALAVIKFH
jgi:hypothetical protein